MEEWETLLWDLSSSLLHSALYVQVDLLDNSPGLVDNTSIDCKNNLSSAASFEDFPDLVVITSKGHTATILTNYMGGYFKMPDVVKNGRPVWQQTTSENYIFYDHNRYWLVGDNYNENLGRICSIRSNLNVLPVQGWEYVSDSWVWEIAHDLRFEPVRPMVPRVGRKLLKKSKTKAAVACGGNLHDSCLNCTTCNSDCFTWIQNWSDDAPCVSKHSEW